jgi:VIT1/CCC1 family predicted Fe2+/Mn2+ transporter
MQDPRYDDLEKRVEKLEEDRDGVVENARLLLRLARYHRAALQELKAGFDVEAGDTRQRFDMIEQKLSEHDKRFDEIDGKLDAHTEVLNKIVSLLEKKEGGE